MNGRFEVKRLRHRLHTTLERAPSPSVDFEAQADFAKYFCVLVSGFLENAIIALVLDIAQRRSAPEIAHFVERRMDIWTNPTCEKIVQLLGSFNEDWRIKAEKYLVDERKATVNSLIALRNKIAHGESVGTTLAQVKGYYATAVDVVDFLSDLIDPP
jgi:hypothetical protein